MTRKVVTIGMDATLLTVRDIFHREKFHHLVVIDEGRAVGVVSDRDLLHHLSPFAGTYTERPQDAHTLDRRVHQIMSRRLVSVTEGTSAREATERLLTGRVSCLPVLDERGRVRGIVTWRDLLLWSMSEVERGRAAA